MTKKSERVEAIIRIPVGIIAYIVVHFWGALIGILAIFHFFFALFTNKRNKSIADFSNLYIGHLYATARYITFATNERPFPFNNLNKPLEKVDMKIEY